MKSGNGLGAKRRKAIVVWKMYFILCGWSSESGVS